MLVLMLMLMLEGAVDVVVGGEPRLNPLAAFVGTRGIQLWARPPAFY